MGGRPAANAGRIWRGFAKGLDTIADRDIIIADRIMTLGTKLRYLRQVEGTLRGLGREMTQQEIVRALKKETGKSISQSYLSQIENGARPHLTNPTRMLLAKFFKVHPGYLVDDPEGFQTELISNVGALEDKLDLWLINGAERFRGDVDLNQALLAVAKHQDSRMCLVLLGAILENPGLAERLLQVLKSPADERRAERKSLA
jgi:transcriptional regulator with XRE-family HTH domain